MLESRRLLTLAPTDDAHPDSMNLPESELRAANIDDTAGILVFPDDALIVTETGAQATFEISLATAPDADVEVQLNVVDPSEAALDLSILEFTTANWNNPQTVTVTGQDDLVDDGDIEFTMDVSATSQGDTNYDGLQGPEIHVVNVDDDSAAIHVSAIGKLKVKQTGGQVAFDISLATMPLGHVTIELAMGAEDDGRVHPPHLNFNSSNWDKPHKVHVSELQLGLGSSSLLLDIVATITSPSDPAYQALGPVELSLEIPNDPPPPFPGPGGAHPGGAALPPLPWLPPHSGNGPIESTLLQDGGVNLSLLLAEPWGPHGNHGHHGPSGPGGHATGPIQGPHGLGSGPPGTGFAMQAGKPADVQITRPTTRVAMTANPKPIRPIHYFAPTLTNSTAKRWNTTERRQSYDSLNIPAMDELVESVKLRKVVENGSTTEDRRQSPTHSSNSNLRLAPLRTFETRITENQSTPEQVIDRIDEEHGTAPPAAALPVMFGTLSLGVIGWTCRSLATVAALWASSSWRGLDPLLILTDRRRDDDEDDDDLCSLTQNLDQR